MEGSSIRIEAPRCRPGRLRFPDPRVRCLVLLLATAVVVGAAVVYVAVPPRSQPTPLLAPVRIPHPINHVVEGAGHFNLTLPLGIIHNPDNTSHPNVSFDSYISFSSGYNGISAVNYTWENVTGPNKLIRILYDPTVPAFPSGPGWFVYEPGGSCVDQCAERIGWGWPYSNSSLIPGDSIYVSYTVYLVTLAPPFVDYSWLEVWFRFGSMTSFACSPGSFCAVNANLTDPLPSELIPAGEPIVLPMSNSTAASYDFNVAEFVNATQVFHAALPRLSFDAGPYGMISAQLVSSFSWSPATQATFRIHGTANQNLTLQMYIDLRFGGMYPVLLG